LDSVGVGAVFALRDTFFSAQKFIRMFQLMWTHFSSPFNSLSTIFHSLKYISPYLAQFWQMWIIFI
jgi:hypothetical protein